MDGPSPIDRLLKQRPRGFAAGAHPVRLGATICWRRNLANHFFPARLTPPQRRLMLARIGETVTGLPGLGRGVAVAMEDLVYEERCLLAERRLVSWPMAQEAGPGCAAFVTANADAALRVNDQDHLCLQCLGAADDLGGLHRQLARLAAPLEQQWEFAADPELGYLTADPTAAGNGLGADVLLHLPGLCLSGQIQGVIRAVGKIDFIMHGRGDDFGHAAGQIYMLGNLARLGESEEETVARVERIVDQVVQHEENARRLLLEKQPEKVFDHVGRAYGILRHAYLITEEEALNLLSALRLGVHLAMFSTLPAAVVDELLLQVRDGHLWRGAGGGLSTAALDSARARLLRQQLCRLEGPAGRTALE